jgi:hypothetical protein
MEGGSYALAISIVISDAKQDVPLSLNTQQGHRKLLMLVEVVGHGSWATTLPFVTFPTCVTFTSVTKSAELRRIL